MAYVLFATKNVPLDPSYKDVIRFEVAATSPATAQDTVPEVRDAFMTTYFRNYADTSSIYKSYANYNEVNFDYGDGVNTVLNYDLSKLLATPQSQYDQVMNLALNSNYLHFRPTPAAGTVEDRFYFIRSARQLNANVVQLVLELDVFTTFPTISITSGMYINRAHLDRFVIKSGSRYWFDINNAAIGDVVDNNYNATIPGTKTTFNVQYTPATAEYTAINDKLNETEWAYFWFSEQPWEVGHPWQSRLRIISAADVPASFNDFTNTSKNPPDLPVPINRGQYPVDKGYNYGLFCAVLPVKTILVYNGVTLEKGWGVGGFYEWAFGETALLGITLSPYAPFITAANGGQIWDKFFIDANGYLSFQTSAGLNRTSGNVTSYKWLNTPEGFLMYHNNISPTQYTWMQRIVLREQFLNTNQFLNLTTNLTTNAVASFTTVPAYNQLRSKSYEPKLFTAPYRKLALKSIYAQETEFSPLEFDGTRVRPRIQDVPNPVQEKLVMSLIGDDVFWTSTSFYNKYFINNLASKTINQYNMPIGSEAWKSFVANRGAQTLAGLGLSVAGTAFGVATGNPLAIAGGIGSIINTGASILQAAVSPDSARANGNDLPADYAYTSDLKTFVTEKILLTQDENRVWDWFFNYGYQPNKVMLFGNVTNGVLRRTRFNYVKAEDMSIGDRIVPFNATMSKSIRERIQKSFNDGITFWTYYGSSSNATVQTRIAFFNNNIFDRTVYENLEKVFAYT